MALMEPIKCVMIRAKNFQSFQTKWNFFSDHRNEIFYGEDKNKEK